MWKVVKYSEHFLSEMINMTAEYYGEDSDISNIKFIIHEYFENPNGQAYICLADDTENNVLAGQYIVIPRNILIGGMSFKSVLSLNTLTRDAYRGQKVFTTLASQVYENCRDEGIIFCYGAPNQNSFPGFINKLKFRKIGTVPLFLKLSKPSWIVYEKTKSTVLECAAKMFNFMGFTPKASGRKKVKVLEITKDNIEVVDELWESLKNKYKVMGERNKQYILWRYFDMPKRKYRIFAAKTNDKLSGYIIGRVTEVAGMRCGMIVDFLFSDRNINAGYSLVQTVKEYFDSERAGLIGCLMLPHAEEAVCLKRMGFFKCPHCLEPQPFPIIFRQFNKLPQKEQRAVLDFSNWFFTMGDYDVI